MKNFGIRSDKALDFLIGDVKEVIWRKFNIKDDIKELNEHSIRKYNSQGFKSSSIYYGKEDSIKLKQIFHFNNAGNKIGYTNYDVNDKEDSYGKFELDDKDRIVRRYHDGELMETYKYDVEDNITHVFHPDIGTDVYMYDGNGFAIKQLSLSEENPLFSSLLGSLFGNGPQKKLTIFINDGWGNIVEMKVYNAETKESLFTQKNSINQQGDEIESVGYNGDGSIYSHVKYTYSYDAMGNWILKQNLSKEGRIYIEEERNIIYYK